MKPSCLQVVRKCAVCNNHAYCCNFGVLTCDPCKMFFRRQVTGCRKRRLVCKERAECCVIDIDTIPLAKPTHFCAKCRLAKCFSVGMSIPSEIKEENDVKFRRLINEALKQNEEREWFFANKFVVEEPDLKQFLADGSKLQLDARSMITCHNISQNKSVMVKTIDWCYYNSILSIHFFKKALHFEMLEIEDRMIVCKHFHIKAAKMFYVLDAMASNKDIIVTPDGQELYPHAIQNFPTISRDFFLRIRYQLLGRFIQLRIGTEETLLLMMILFCNPTLDSLSEHAVKILSDQQKFYSSALLQFCSLKYQKGGTSRYMELMSLAPLINRSQTDIEHLIIMFQVYYPNYELRNLMRVQ